MGKLEVYDQTVGQHRISFITKDDELEWVIIDDAHFTVDEFEEMMQRYENFLEESDDA